MKQKHTYAILLFLLILKFGVSQDKAILVSNLNPDIEEEVVFIENQRIQVITNRGKKHSGRLRILDNENILLKKTEIEFDHITMIKSNKLFIDVLISASTILSGAIISLIGFVNVYNNPHLARPTLIGGPMLIGIGIFDSPNPAKRYRQNKGWQFKIIDHVPTNEKKLKRKK